MDFADNRTLFLRAALSFVLSCTALLLYFDDCLDGWECRLYERWMQIGLIHRGGVVIGGVSGATTTHCVGTGVSCTRALLAIGHQGGQVVGEMLWHRI